MLLYENPFCKISFDTETSILTILWLAHPDNDSFFDIYVNAIRFSEAYKAKYVLADNTLGVQFDVATQNKIVQIGAKMLQDSGIRKYARVVSYDAFQEIVSYKMADSMLAQIPDAMQFQVFANRSSAIKWLLQPDPIY